MWRASAAHDPAAVDCEQRWRTPRLAETHGTLATQPPQRSAAALSPRLEHKKRPIPERRANVLNVLFGQVAGLDPGPSLGRSRDAFVRMGGLDIDGPGKARPSERKAEDRHRLATLCLGDAPVFPKTDELVCQRVPELETVGHRGVGDRDAGSVRRKEIDTAPRLEGSTDLPRVGRHRL